MAQLTRQEVQQIVDGARKNILDRVLSRQDIVRATEAIRDRLMNYTQDILQVHQQNLIRRNDTQITELAKRLISIENRVAGMEQEIKIVINLLQQLAEREPQQVIMPVMAEGGKPVTPERRYTYAST